jgi:transcriptional regulator with XRE-family HTH domain
MNIGEKIKQLRTDKNLTQPQLAEAIGIEQSYLSKLENDKSVPSADIFQAILKALAVDVGSFLEGIDDKIIHRQLRQIPEVANYLQAGVAYKIHNIKKWLYGSAAACVLGLTLIVAGYKGLIFSDDQYYYFSEGIVLVGESKDIFSNWGTQFQLLLSEAAEIRNAKAREMFQRKNEDFLVVHEYRGDKFNLSIQGGSRTYSLMNTTQMVRTENRIFMLIGTLLVFTGVFGFFIEARLRKI